MNVKISFLSLYCCGIFFILTSCSLSPAIRTDTIGVSSEPNKLLTIRIERWDEELFSGFLGLRKDAEFSYILLDATGVKLLEAEVSGGGGHNLQAKGPLKESDLAPFLSEALSRIYLQEPDRTPCAGSWFYRLCRENHVEIKEKSWKKHARTGFFTIWQASGSTIEGDKETVVYSQPWLGVSIELEPMMNH